jgi:tetrapyrrole methylase family protein/MazG family protein
MPARVTVVGLGPGGPDLVTAGTLAEVAVDRPRFVRTTRHPASAIVTDAVSFDVVYDGAERIDEVYPAIVEQLCAAAEEHGSVLYAVPGSPSVAERTVELLVADNRVQTELIPALSFLDLVWTRLGIDPLAEGVRIVDGHRFAASAAGERGPLVVCQCDSRDVLSDIKLAIDDPPTQSVTFVQRLGLPDESIRSVAWDELDRDVEPDHLTSLYIPRLSAPIAAEVQSFADMVRVLRQECPWDREQTHESLIRYLLEETYEVVDAIESGDSDDLEEELGDLLFQVVFHSTIAAEEGWFTLADVARGVNEKLVARHPHVFGDAHVDGVEDLLNRWELQKVTEKDRDSVMDGIPRSLPALLLAAKVQKKAASSGFGLANLDGAYADLGGELAELHESPGESELGDVLFAAVQVARQLSVDPEHALRQAADRFADRFRFLEIRASAAGSTIAETDVAELIMWWQDAKAAEA